MCEQFVARASEPFRLEELWPFVERLERFGIAGFGWGAAWTEPGGRIGCHRDVRAFRDDPARDAIGALETTSLLLHLRRPSRLSTLDLPDTQPFADPNARFAFSHNGDLRDWRPARARYRAEGRIHGRADSEVGQRWLEDRWDDSGDLADRGAAYHAEPANRSRPALPAAGPGLLAELHATFGGHANLATLAADGSVRHYAGNDENPIFTFRLARIGIASTAIYSVDRSLFRFAARGATDRRLVRLQTTVTLDRDGEARPLRA